jgi:L-fuconolactonase
MPPLCWKGMRIDAHQQFLKNYLPDHVERILRRNRFDGLIAVQAVQAAQSAGETRWLLALAARYPLILGVIGGWDLTVLDEFQRQAKFKGISQEAAAATVDGLRELARRGLVCELVAGPDQLDRVRRAAEAVPDLRIVIPHMGKPRMAEGVFAGWAQEMERIAGECPRVTVKLSGLLPPGMPALRPYLQHLLRVFGPDRLMFGSDWPSCLQAADTWKMVLATFTQALGPQTMEVRAKLLGETAQRVYRLA